MVDRFALAKMIEGSLLDPSAARRQIVDFCERAVELHVASVCVFPYWAADCARVLSGSDVRLCVPTGLPFGICAAQVKLLDAKGAISAGANEIDFVVNMGALKSCSLSVVERELGEMINLSRLAGMTDNREVAAVNMVLEADRLTDEELGSACKIALHSGVEFIKTSTGLMPSHPIPKEVRLIRQRVGQEIGIKVAGDVRTAAEVMELVNAGATRVGTRHMSEVVEAGKPNPKRP